jgi:hypothetical protein
LGVVFSIGCGDSSSSETGQLRVFMGAVGSPSTNILVDGETVTSNLGYGSATTYLTVKAGSRHVQAVPVGGGSAILDATLSITSSKHQTLLITGTSSSAQSTLLADGGTTAVTGDGHIRVFNASSMVASDVYIVPAGTGLVGATPVTTTPLGFNGNTDYQAVPTGNYEVFFTIPATFTVNLGTGPLNLPTGNVNQTIVAFDAVGGGFTYILFTDQ